MNRHFAGVCAGAALVLIGSFLPWGSLEGTARERFGSAPRTRVAITLTAWNGYVSYPEIRVDNWVVVLAAAGAAVLSWLRGAGRDFSVLVPLLLVVGGALHALVFVALLIGPSGGTVGVGSVLTVGALIGMGVALLGPFRTGSSGDRGTPPTGSVTGQPGR